MKYIQIIFFVLISFAANAQQRVTPTLTGKGRALGFGVNDTIGYVTDFSDQTGFAFNLNYLEKNALILDQSGTFWVIDSIYNTNVLYANIKIAKVQGSGSYPSGDVAIMNITDYGLISPATTNSIGITPKQQAEILNYSFTKLDSLISLSGIGAPVNVLDNYVPYWDGDSWESSAIQRTSTATRVYSTLSAKGAFVAEGPVYFDNVSEDTSATKIAVLSGVNRLRYIDKSSLGGGSNQAIDITVDSITNLSATNVQAALAEHQADIDAFTIGAADGVVIGGTYDSTTQRINFDVRNPGDTFSVDVSQLTKLTEAEVDTFVANNGYLTAFTESDPIWLAEKINYATIAYVDANDDDTQLTEAQVDSYVANNGYLTDFTESDPVWLAEKADYATTAYVDANDAVNTVNTTTNFIPYWDGDSWENALSYTTDNLDFTSPSPVFNVNSTDNTTTSSIYFSENGVLLGALLQQNLNNPTVDRQGDLELFVDPDGNDFVIYTNGVGSGKNFEIKKTGETIIYNTLNLESVAQDDTATKIAALNASNEVVYRDASTLGGGGTDSVSWNLLTDVPDGFADGFDNVASEGTGDGVTTSGTYNAVTETIDFTGTEGVSYSVDVSALLDNTDTQLTQDQVQDFAGLLFGTDTESLISTSYDNTTNTLTFTVDNNLDNYDNTMSQFLKTEVDGSITNEANTGMAWDDATNTLSVTDPNGTVSAIITGYLEEITGTELVFDGWDKDASDDLVDADFTTSGLMATDGVGNYSVVSEYDPSSTNEIQGLQSVTDVSGYTTNDITLNKLHADNSIAVYDSTITGANLSLGSIDLQMTTELNILGRGWVGSEIPIGGSSFVNLDIGNAQFGVFGSGNFDTGTAFRIGTAGSIPGTTADPFELDIDFTGYRGRPKARIRAINKDNDNRSSYLSFWVNEQVNNTDSFLERMRIAENGNVGIGTTSPFFKLDVNGTFRTTGTNIFGSVANDETATKIAGLNASNQLVYRDVSTLIDDADADPTNEYNTSVSWDDATNTLTVNDGGGDKSVIITGFDDSYDYMVTTVKNEVGSGFTISKGDLVGFAGAPGNSTEVFGNLFSGAQDQSYNVIGVAAEPIAEDAKGSVVTEGVLTGINTEGFVDGTLLYASTTTPGALTSDNSSHIMVATVLHGNVTNGSILIRPDYYANENDPTFSASDAASIAAADIANWNAAYGWGDHSTAGYATTTYADQAEQDAKDYADANDDNTQNTVNTADNTIPYWNTTTSSWESSNIVHGAEDITISGSTTILTQATDASRGLDVYQGYIRAQPYSDNNAAYVMNNAAGTTNLTIRPNGDNSIIKQANANGTLDLETSNLSLSTLAENAGNAQVLTYDASGNKLVGFADISSLGGNQTLQDVTDQGATTTNVVNFARTIKVGDNQLDLANGSIEIESAAGPSTFLTQSNNTLVITPDPGGNSQGFVSFSNQVGKTATDVQILNGGNFKLNYVVGSNNGGKFIVDGGATSNGASLHMTVNNAYPTISTSHYGSTGTARDLRFDMEYVTKMVLDVNGNLGVNILDPQYRLDVDGTVRFQNISNGSTFDQILARNSTTGEIGFTTDQTGTDDQTIDVLSLDGTTLNISLENDGETTKTLDLSPLASGGGLTWDDQTKVSYVYSGEDLDLSTVFTGDFRNYHIVLNTENISSSRASLPTPSATYEKYLVMVTCIDPGAGGCFVDNVGVAGSTLSEFMYPGDAAFVKCVKIDNVGTYGWVMTESDAALVDVTLQTVTDNGNTTTNNIETSGSLTVGADLNLSSVNIATDLSQVGDGILTIDDGVVTRVSTSVFADQDAIEVPFTSTSTLSSTNVQDAIEELDTELRNKVDNYIVASNQVNVTISNGIMNQFTKIDLNSSASATLTVSGTPTTGGVYTFFFQNGSNTTINLPTNFSDESGNALNLTVTGGKWITCLYDNTNNNDTYYCK